VAQQEFSLAAADRNCKFQADIGSFRNSILLKYVLKYKKKGFLKVDAFIGRQLIACFDNVGLDAEAQ